MKDYTLEGVPVAEVSTEDIEGCLANGIEIITNGGDCSVTEAIAKVIERLELELFIRQLGLRNEIE